MRTVHPRATGHAVAFSLTASVTTINAAAAGNDAAAVTAASAAAIFAAAAAAFRTGTSFAFHSRLRRANQDAARTDTDYDRATSCDRARARQTAATGTRSNVCRAINALQHCCHKIPARHGQPTTYVLRSVRPRCTRQISVVTRAPAPRVSKQPVRPPVRPRYIFRLLPHPDRLLPGPGCLLQRAATIQEMQPAQTLLPLFPLI
jgi:hypothetical protein